MCWLLDDDLRWLIRLGLRLNGALAGGSCVRLSVLAGGSFAFGLGPSDGRFGLGIRYFRLDQGLSILRPRGFRVCFRERVLLSTLVSHKAGVFSRLHRLPRQSGLPARTWPSGLATAAPDREVAAP